MAVPRLDDLGERLGIALRDPEAIQQAFVHSSYFNENPHAVSGHNERLEFLGDAVIGLIVSRLLYERFPDEDEGLLDGPARRLVNRDALASFGLGSGWTDTSCWAGRVRSRGRLPPIAAGRRLRGAGRRDLPVRGDGGQSRVADPRSSKARCLATTNPEPLKSAKSRLQEWSQREHRIKPHYELVSTSGPAHEQTFTVAAVLRGERIAFGQGSSRQRAEEQAARLPCDSMGAQGLGA